MVTAVLPLCAFLPILDRKLVFLLAFVPVFMLLLIKLYKEDRFLSGGLYEILFESLFILAGVMAVVI